MDALLKPGLYQLKGAPSAPDRPALLGGRCAACGRVFFPMQAYGCEACGSVELHPQELAGLGTLVASARVHLHPGKGREAPFTIVAVKLEDGPVARTLAVEDGGDLHPGARMAAVMASVVDSEGEPRLDLRFEREV